MYAVKGNSVRSIASVEGLLPGETMYPDDATQVQDALKSGEASLKRNSLLRTCDWTTQLDNTLSAFERQAWTAYRQLLRDLPQQSGFPRNIVWPVPPQLSGGAGNELPEQS